MTGKDKRNGWRLAGAVGLMALGLGCAPSLANGQAASPTLAGQGGSANPGQAPRLDHVMPARDSIGRAPARFSWTAVEGAEEYSIGVWNEVDQMIWRQDHIKTNSVDRPEDVRLEPGTYFWSVSALEDKRELAASGLAAFVVRTTP